jgi:hypothetical protein
MKNTQNFLHGATKTRKSKKQNNLFVVSQNIQAEQANNQDIKLHENQLT